MWLTNQQHKHGFWRLCKFFLCENAVLSSIFFGWVFCTCWGDFMTPFLLLCFIKHFYCDIELIFNLFVCILRRWYKPTTKGPKSSLGWNVVESVSSHVVLNKSDHFSLHIHVAWKSSTVYFYLIHGCLFIWIWKKFLEYIFRFSSKAIIVLFIAHGWNAGLVKPTLCINLYFWCCI